VEKTESLDRPDLQVRMVFKDLPERPELVEKTESLDLPEQPELQAKTESQDLLEQLDLQVRMEPQDRQVPLERLELRDQLETTDLVSTFLVTCLARGIFQFQATQERRT
jgi:hypothetical protein